MMTRTIRGVVALLGLLLAAGCSFDGFESMQLPGGKGTGNDALKVTVEIPNVGTLTPNSQVKVNDIAVGTVTRIRVRDWHAEADLSLEKGVRLPADAVARVGVNSLLGSSFVELATPPSGGSGALTSGARIPLERGEAYPATEQVLASASVVLNGGGLEQLSTITAELNKAFGGGDLAVRDLIPRLDSFVGTLNSQQGDIVAAINDVDRLSRRFARGRGTITKALDELGPALRTLSKERPQLTQALQSLSTLGSVATPLVAKAKADLVANLRDLVPALLAVAEAGGSVARGLGYALTFPFPTDTIANACRSDYCNLFATIDLTSQALVEGFIGPDGKPTIPGLPGLPTSLLDLFPGLSAVPGLGGPKAGSTALGPVHSLLGPLGLGSLIGGTP